MRAKPIFLFLGIILVLVGAAGGNYYLDAYTQCTSTAGRAARLLKPNFEDACIEITQRFYLSASGVVAGLVLSIASFVIKVKKKIPK